MKPSTTPLSLDEDPEKKKEKETQNTTSAATECMPETTMNPYDPVGPAYDNVSNESIMVVNKTDDTLTTATEEEEEEESEQNARRKLKDWGFDPDDVSKGSSDWYSSHLLLPSNINYCVRNSFPIVIFSQLADLPMIKYIVKRTCSNKNGRKKCAVIELTKCDECGLFPLYTAISRPNKENHVLSVFQWLFANGANIHQTVGGEWSALSRACILGYEKVATWLVMEGALLDGDGQFDYEIARMDVPPSYDQGESKYVVEHVHRKLFLWAHETIKQRHNFMLFLSGTIMMSAPQQTKPRTGMQQLLTFGSALSSKAAALLLQDIPEAKLTEVLAMTTRSSPPLTVFNGQHGILELIGEFLGVERKIPVLTTVKGLIEHEKWWKGKAEESCKK